MNLTAGFGTLRRFGLVTSKNILQAGHYAAPKEGK